MSSGAEILAEDTVERESTSTKLIEIAVTVEMKLKLVCLAKLQKTRGPIAGAARATIRCCRPDISVWMSRCSFSNAIGSDWKTLQVCRDRDGL